MQEKIRALAARDFHIRFDERCLPWLIARGRDPEDVFAGLHLRRWNDEAGHRRSRNCPPWRFLCQLGNLFRILQNREHKVSAMFSFGRHRPFNVNALHTLVEMQRD